MKTLFRVKLQQLINSESMENGSNTPDFILAEFLGDVLEAWERAVEAREKWYGRQPEKVPYYAQPKAPPHWEGLLSAEKHELPEGQYQCEKCGGIFEGTRRICHECEIEPTPAGG